MLSKNRIYQFTAIAGVIYISLFICSCNGGKDKPDVSDIPVNIKVERFERDFFWIDPRSALDGFVDLKNKYGTFSDLFLFQVTGIGSRDTLLMLDRMKGFVRDTNLVAVYYDTQKLYKDFTNEEKELEQAFRYYKYYFPSKSIPGILTMISGFSYSIVNDSTWLAIGLDMYIGSDYKYYSTIEPALPVFMRNRMRREYIVNDAMKGWVLSDYAIDETSAKMIDFMISHGRILFFLEHVLPDQHDSISTGYSNRQLEWCMQNEKQIWSFFVDNKLLFSSDPNQMMKYVNDGPTTNGFPKESPGNIGQFLGWRIVRSYMKNHPEVTLQKLMEEKDLQKIFSESKYKPER